MKKTGIIILVFISLSLSLSIWTYSGFVEGFSKVTLYLFWGDGCPHCENEKQFLAQLQNQYPQLEVKFFEVLYNEDNSKFLSQMNEAYGNEKTGVPTTFLDDKFWVGFADFIGEDIQDKVESCIINSCPSPVEKSIILAEAEQTASGVTSTVRSSTTTETTQTTQSEGLEMELVILLAAVVVILAVAAIILLRKRR